LAVYDAGEGEEQAASQFSAGSSARAASPRWFLQSSTCRWLRRELIACSFVGSLGVVASISLPVNAGGTPWNPRNIYIRARFR